MLDPVLAGITSIEMIVILLVLARLATSSPPTSAGSATAWAVTALSPTEHLPMLALPLFLANPAVSWLRYSVNAAFAETARMAGECKQQCAARVLAHLPWSCSPDLVALPRPVCVDVRVGVQMAELRTDP